LETLTPTDTDSTPVQAKAKVRKPRTDAIPAQAKEFLVGLLEAKNDGYEERTGTRPYEFVGVKGKYVLARRNGRARPTLFHLNGSKTKLVVSKLHRCTSTGKVVAK
jgi:hypothetical protein